MKLELVGAKVDDFIQVFGLRVLVRNTNVRVVEIDEDDLDHITDQAEQQCQLRWRVVP